MNHNAKKVKHSKGQIFLVVTVIVLLYSMSIAFTMLSAPVELSRNTNPNSDLTPAIVSSIITEVHMISQVILGGYTQNKYAETVAENNLVNALDDMADLYTSQGIAITVSETNFNIQKAVPTDNQPEANITYTLSIDYFTGGTTYTFTTDIYVSVKVQFDGSTPTKYAYVLLTLTNQEIPVSSGDTTGSTAIVVSLGNGAYDVSSMISGQTFQIITDTGILVEAQIP